MDRVVDVWWVDTAVAPPDAALWPLLDAAERARFASYQEPRAARMFLVGAALVRCLAARELGSSPREVPVDRLCPDCGKPHGRPVVAHAATGADLQLSVSHSGGLVGVAVAWCRVGLDVEAFNRSVDLLALAGEFLSPAELTALEGVGLGEDPELLLLWWTRKEAVLKLNGTGLRQPLTSVSLRVYGAAVEVSTAGGRTERLGLSRLTCRPGFVSSLATPAPVSIAEHDAAGLLNDARHGAASA